MAAPQSVALPKSSEAQFARLDSVEPETLSQRRARGVSPYERGFFYALQFCQGFDHALTQFCVGQSADAATHIVFEVLNIVRCRNGAGHRRMGDDPFQKKLRPGPAIKFRREIGQRLSADATEKIAAAKRTINNDGDAMLLREGKIFSSASRSMIE